MPPGPGTTAVPAASHEMSLRMGALPRYSGRAARTHRSAAENLGRGSVEVACDESGYESGKVIGGTTDVFAHASVALATEPAAACMRELRRRIRSPATEYKANPLLREKTRPVLVWLLGPAGPSRRPARVYLMDKALFVL